MDDAREPDVRVRERVVDRRRDDGVDRGRDPPRDLVRDEPVGEQRPVRAVLLGRADRDDHGLVLVGQERLDLGGGHLAEEHGLRLHGAGLVCSDGGGELPDALDPAGDGVARPEASGRGRAAWRGGPASRWRSGRRAGGRAWRLR